MLTNWLIGAASRGVRATEGSRIRGRCGRCGRAAWCRSSTCSWAPVFVIELAGVEERLTWLRRPIVVWWCVWFVSTAGVGVLDRDQLHHRRPGHRRQHRDDHRGLSARLAALLLADQGVPRVRASARRAAVKRWVIVADARDERRDADPDAEPENRRFRLSPNGAEPGSIGLMNSGDGALGGHPFVVAHRGASADRPEHTVAAYELALQRGRRRRRVRRPADPRRPSGLRARPQGGPHVERHRAGQRDDAGAAARIRLRRLASQLAGRRQPRRHRAAHARRPRSRWCSTGTGRSRSSSRPSIRCATARWWRARCWRCCTGTASPRRRRPTCPARW